MKYKIFILLTFSIYTHTNIFEEIASRTQSGKKHLKSIYKKKIKPQLITTQNALTKQIQEVIAKSPIPDLQKKLTAAHKTLHKKIKPIYKKHQKEYSQVATQIKELQKKAQPLLVQKEELERKIKDLAQPYVQKLQMLGNTITEKSKKELAETAKEHQQITDIKIALQQEEAKLYSKLAPLHKKQRQNQRSIAMESAQLPASAQTHKQSSARMQDIKRFIENPEKLLEIDYKELLD